MGLYLRVSTSRKPTTERDRRPATALLARCSKEGWADMAEYVDAGISGKSTEGRAEFNRMMADAPGGSIQIVMAAKLDRIARNTIDFLQTADELQG